MPVIESFDHFSCLETLNNYFHNKEPKNIKTLFELQKQNKYFYKTLGNMESFYCSYVGIKRTLLSQNITGNQRKEGNSILITIMNRTKNLLSYFDTWVHQKLLDEIIIVDWSTCDEEKQTIVDFLSSYPNYPSFLKSVLLVRVEGETDYYRTVAQNVGASFANFNKVLKLDSDISLKEDSFLMHPLCQNEFYVGDWKLARNENEKYTHGNIYLFTKDFFNINGYDERIRSYGWEDSDFTQRLELSGLEKKYSVQELRAKIGIVSQSTRLFNTSALHNMIYGSEWMSKDEKETEKFVSTLLKLLEVSDMFEKMPRGILSSVGIGGEDVSGGY